jgi:hypothetical protein
MQNLRSPFSTAQSDTTPRQQKQQNYTSTENQEKAP